MAEIELNLEMDATERVQIEITHASCPMNAAIGNYLLNQFANDEVLKKCYKGRKITLEAIGKYVEENANKMLNGQSGAIEDKVVYGWVIHFIQDEKVEITEASTITLTEQEKKDAHAEALKEYKADMLHELEQRSTKAAKPKKEKKDDGQLSLFE